MKIKVDTDAVNKQLDRINKDINEVDKGSKNNKKADHDIKSFHEFDNNFVLAMQTLSSYQSVTAKDITTLKQNTKSLDAVDDFLAASSKSGRPSGQ